jgi:hypothetical protein
LTLQPPIWIRLDAETGGGMRLTRSGRVKLIVAKST